METVSDKRTGNNGFVIVLTIMVIALMTSIATYLSYRTTIFSSYASIAIKREKAKLLALSGIQVAISQLVHTSDPKDSDELRQEEKKEKKKKESDDKPLLAKLLPILNRWQVYKLTEEIDGISGTIKLCISSEDGKININQLYDFKNSEFIAVENSDISVRAVLEDLFTRIESELGVQDLFASFESFLKKRKEPIEDISELLSIESFQIFKNKIFYEPFGNNQPDGKAKIYLADLFTVWPTTWGIEPWLFSDSLSFILGIKQAQPNDKNERKESVEKWLEKFKPNAQWRKEWDTVLKPVYEKEFTSLPKGIDFILRSRFIPNYFSILVDGEFNSVTQRMVAIVERVRESSRGAEASMLDVKIRRLYWI